MHFTTLLLPILSLPVALSTHIRITIPPSPQIPIPGSLPPSTSATLTTLSTIHTSPLRADNTFDFRNVSTGSYLLDVHCATHAFAPLRVDIHEGAAAAAALKEESSEIAEVQVWGTFRGNEWDNKGEKLPVKEVVGVEAVKSKIWLIEAKALVEKNYLMERTGFSPLSLLKNPMILIACASMAVVFGMPYLMDNLDPEMKAEFEQRQKSTPSIQANQNPLQNFDAAAWLAGSSSKKSEPPADKGITR